MLNTIDGLGFLSLESTPGYYYSKETFEVQTLTMNQSLTTECFKSYINKNNSICLNLKRYNTKIGIWFSSKIYCSISGQENSNMTTMVSSFLNLNMSQMEVMGLAHTKPGVTNVPAMVSLAVNNGEKIYIQRDQQPVVIQIAHEKVFWFC